MRYFPSLLQNCLLDFSIFWTVWKRRRRTETSGNHGNQLEYPGVYNVWKKRPEHSPVLPWPTYGASLTPRCLIFGGLLRSLQDPFRLSSGWGISCSVKRLGVFEVNLRNPKTICALNDAALETGLYEIFFLELFEKGRNAQMQPCFQEYGSVSTIETSVLGHYYYHLRIIPGEIYGGNVPYVMRFKSMEPEGESINVGTDFPNKFSFPFFYYFRLCSRSIQVVNIPLQV